MVWDWKDSEDCTDLRAALADANRRIERLEAMLVWTDRIQREAKAVERNKGNFNSLELALKGYRKARKDI